MANSSDYGFVGVAEKPYSLNKLLALVKRIISG
jgi:hypothetical protein